MAVSFLYFLWQPSSYGRETNVYLFPQPMHDDYDLRQEQQNKASLLSSKKFLECLMDMFTVHVVSAIFPPASGFSPIIMFPISYISYFSHDSFKGQVRSLCRPCWTSSRSPYVRRTARQRMERSSIISWKWWQIAAARSSGCSSTRRWPY